MVGLERRDRFNVEIAVAIGCHEVMLPVDLDDETLLAAELFAERSARSSEFPSRFVETFG
ncbi:hypothetical protein RE6C_02873 [Rhodopirellula europaea 6C]|uniref:Uncharacterized protein n=1 Tax=Rhodopirellula europaea 6C TaxID=1263867 RepID=M2B453_9BACT|nr:hypothetical protein RE6C_02873 [Rhodopirellula europaea 6C]